MNIGILKIQLPLILNNFLSASRMRRRSYEACLMYNIQHSTLHLPICFIALHQKQLSIFDENL